MRPYALVHGRVAPTHDLDRMSLVKARVAPPTDPLQSHYADTFDLCRSTRPLSVAEIAGRLGHPLQIVKIWVSDLLDDGYLTHAMPADSGNAASDPQILEEVLAGLRRTL